MAQTTWIAVDVDADSPNNVLYVLEDALNENPAILRWRLINPANEQDQAEFARVGKELTSAFENTEVEGQLELPFAEEG